jgi:hypothetical protein
MKRIAFLSIMVLMIVSSPLSATSWSGGYRIGFDGYASPSFSRNDYISFSLVHESYGPLQMNVGVSAPLHDGSYGTLLSFGLGSGMYVFQDHPLDTLFRRDSALSPRLELSLLFDVAKVEFSHITLIFQPLSLDFGDKRIGVLGAIVTRDFPEDAWGWGIRLFEITHYVW